MGKDITIALTSCWRYKLLKKTIESLWKNIDFSQYEKVMTEDSKNENHLKKIEYENKNWFLKWWKIIYTCGSWHTETFKSHLSALKILYDHISTDYVFHCEDDWFFKKVDYNFLDLSKKLLQTHENIWIVLLRNFDEDWWLNSANHTKEERFKELFDDRILEFQWKSFRFLNILDCVKWFTLNPWLRRTQEIKSLMFKDDEIRISEEKIWERFTSAWLSSINLEPWIILHTWYWIYTTWFNNLFNDGFFIWIKNIFTNVLYNSFKYRSKLLLRNVWIESFIQNPKNYIKIMESPLWYIIDFFLWLYRKYTVKEVDENITNNIEWIKELNIPLSWFTENKPLWISWVARLKNSDDFLEKIIESYIPYLDEIILVNNLSTDKTKEICKKLVKKYPKKIKYFEYPYALWWYVWDKDYPTNSIYSMAYYTNWCFSKSKYKYVMRLDDDNLPIAEKRKKIKDYIINKQPNKYCIYWGYNILKRNNDYWIFKKDFFSWIWWDHWIFPVSKKTYCIQMWYYEHMLFGLQYKRFWFSFLHLKYLKEKKWQINLSNRMHHLFISQDIFYNNFLKINDKNILRLITWFFKIK